MTSENQDRTDMEELLAKKSNWNRSKFSSHNRSITNQV